MTTGRPTPNIPPPVEGGTEHLESLGRIVDRILGDERMRRRVRRLNDELLRADDVPDDPEPAQAPEPVPGGTEPLTKDGDPPSELR